MSKLMLFMATWLFALSGCASSSYMEKISLGYTKEEVRQAISAPRVVRGAMQNKYGQTIEVWEYRLTVPIPGMILQTNTVEPRVYWLYFVDGKLVRWGEAGDWQTETKNLYEIRFTDGDRLTLD